MENQFFVDSEHLSSKALLKKHRLENEPAFRSNHMEYMEGMEIIESDVCSKVMEQMKSYDYNIYTASDVKTALEHDVCTIEDFKALLSPAAKPFLEQMAQRARLETSKHFGNTVYLFTPLYIANYCENYCVYCGFNCYNHIKRMKLNMEQIEKEMQVIADSGMEEILILTGESRGMSNVEYIGEACKLLFNMYFRFLFVGGIDEYEDDTEYAPSGCVSFLTIHQSKGMEFPIVVVGSLGNVPKNRNEAIMDDIAMRYHKRPPFEPADQIKYFDFWRLYYTAFSRAQDLLVLTANETNREPSLYFREVYDTTQSDLNLIAVIWNYQFE